MQSGVRLAFISSLFCHAIDCCCCCCCWCCMEVYFLLLIYIDRHAVKCVPCLNPPIRMLVKHIRTASHSTHRHCIEFSVFSVFNYYICNIFITLDIIYYEINIRIFSPSLSFVSNVQCFEGNCIYLVIL